jgi:hypothetical protein
MEFLSEASANVALMLAQALAAAQLSGGRQTAL